MQQVHELLDNIVPGSMMKWTFKKLTQTFCGTTEAAVSKIHFPSFTGRSQPFPKSSEYNAPSLSIQKEDELHVGEDTTKVGKVAHFTGKNTSQAWGRYSGQRLMAQRSIVSIPPCKVAITKVKLDKYLRTKIQSHQVGKDKGNYKEEILEKV